MGGVAALASGAEVYASSTHEHCSTTHAKINDKQMNRHAGNPWAGGWCPASNKEQNPWIGVKLGEPQRVFAVET